MKQSAADIAKTILCLIFFAAALAGDDWTTVGNDAQRSGWVRADTKISAASVGSPEFQMLWKMEFGGEQQRGGALTAPVLLDFLISHRGFRSLGFMAASSGAVFTMDTDLARPEWDRPLGGAAGNGSGACPGGMTANLSRPTEAALPSLGGFGARGRRTPGKSGAGQPKEGAVTLAAAASSPPRPTAPTARDTRTRPPAARALRGLSLVYALSADGMLHSLYVSNGHDHDAPVAFLPPNADARGLIVVDNVAYVATFKGCGGVPDGIWALDLETKKVSQWKSSAGSVAGLIGPAIGTDGVVYAATEQGSLVALEAKTLKPIASSAVKGFGSSPIVIDYEKKDYIAAAAAGSLHLLDAAKLDAAAVTTEAFFERSFSPGALAAWRDSSGTSWILVPSVEQGKGSIVAWKITDDNGRPALERGWQSPRIDRPLPPIVVNGVVFAVAGGQRGSTPAKLYALDGVTGKALWNSGAAISAAAAGYALSSGPAHIYLATLDSALYAFGIPIAH